ncbi:hypothetical protein C8J56DRAFT_1081892 [Mycena floridula]|nr:hypothetical protein C8J56DRAFT_1081892 [Mycena floridula]
MMDLQTEISMNWNYFKCRAQSILDWKKDIESPGLNNLLETKHLYFFCPPKVADNIYWLRDEEEQHIIEDSLIQAAFGINVDWDWDPLVYQIPHQYYEILRKIHEACGFDPYSTQVADYLGLPLLVIDNGYSGLEECGLPLYSTLDHLLRDLNEDLEDSEYTSETESEDSDYVSASGDA